MDQELFLRDDIIQFTSKLDSQNYNVKAFRKRNSVSKNKTQKKFFISSECDLSELLQNRPLKQTDRTQRTTQILSTKRLSSTSAVKKRSQINQSHTAFIKTARTKNNSCLEEQSDFETNKQQIDKHPKLGEIKEPKMNKFAMQEKQISKNGQLKNKHFEYWLNQIIQQYCHDQKFDSTIENPALKKYGIDKNSLLSKGINPESIQRLFKSLFVYSMGFNSLLGELCGKNMSIRKTFWKVYAMLLQYCSNGDFQTMIGQIERDKIKKMQTMKHQIQRRQEIIENNDQINLEKNAKIFKQLRILKEENMNLENDKIVLLQDYKEAEQAFNQEVSLRLKFQNKINEIHGVHRQLDIKHQRLYEELQAKIIEIKNVKSKNQDITQQNLNLKNENEFVKMENENLKQQAKFTANLTDQIKRKYSKIEMQEIDWRHRNQSLVLQIRQREKNIEQLKNGLKNAELMIKLREQSQKQLQKQYKRSLQQNKELVTSLQKQLEQINNQMLQKKQFQQLHSRVYAEVQYLKTKLEEKTNDNIKNQQQIKRIQQNLNQKISQVQVAHQRNLQLDSDIKDCYKKIEQMKKVKTAIEESLIEAKSKQEIYKNYYLQKQNLINSLNEKVQKLQRSVSQFNINKKILQSKLQLLTQKALVEEETSKKKIEKLQEENAILDKQMKEMKEQLQVRRVEQQKYMVLYEESFHKLKNEIFERNDLELRYRQSLTVVESETDHIKNLTIKISQVQERNQEHVRKIRGLQFIMAEKEKTHQIQINLLNSNVNQLMQQMKIQKTYVHPMRYQEILSQYQRLNDKMLRLQKDLKKRTFRQAETSNLQVVKANSQKDLAQIKLHYEQLLDQKNIQLYQSIQNAQNLKKMLQNLQSSLGNPKNDELGSNYNFKQKQRKYLQVIKQKTHRIQQLYKEVQAMHDQNSHLVERLKQAEDSIKYYQNQISKMQKERQSLSNQKNALLNQRAKWTKEQQKLLTKLADIQANRSEEEFNGKYISNNETQLQGKQGRHDHHTRQNSSRDQESRAKAIQPGWRNDFAKKMRNATNYYKK